MIRLNIHEAKTHLSRYLPLLEAGETIILCKRNVPIAEIKAEAAKMDVEQLRAVAKKYKDALTEKKAELQKLTESLAKVPLTEKLGKEAQGLTADIENLMMSVNALSERFVVYYDQIKAKGGELKDLEL